jgi:ribosomal protein S6--L-glutamate ligase
MWRNVRIAIFLEPEASGRPAPRINPVTAEVVAGLRAKGATVDLFVPEAEAVALGEVRPAHDLYVLKSKTPMARSLAWVLTLAGAPTLNTVRSCDRARDKVATTALLAAAGVPVPTSWAAGEPSLLDRLLGGGPLWLKAPGGSKGRGIRRLLDAEHLEGVRPDRDPAGLPLPLLVQREVPGDGTVLKVYVVGERVWARLKPWPVRTVEDKLGVPAPLRSEVRAAALTCGQALGLEVYGVDVLLAGDAFFVVDVNPFPGFRGDFDLPGCLTEYIYQGALAPRAARSGAAFAV